jgi:hypothetical protein
VIIIKDVYGMALVVRIHAVSKQTKLIAKK